MSRTPSTSTQEIQMDMFDHHPHTQVRPRNGKGMKHKYYGNIMFFDYFEFIQNMLLLNNKAVALLKINRLFVN